MDRFAVTEVRCNKCHAVQAVGDCLHCCLIYGITFQVSNTCIGCGIQFGKYFCHVCNYYDNEDKGQYHCDGCGICR